ncbi:MAG: hypothetical protein JST76_11465 [Bacteroidetes bacterium]|nr:hypothetical protein [Bacteroidota bacterium]
MIYIILFIAFVVAVAYWVNYREVENPQHWQCSFDFEFSSEEFYQLVQRIVEEKKIPKVKFSRVFYSQYGMLSDKREYLHIVKGEFIYDVCAAPYGASFFVSMWNVTRPSVLKKLGRKVKWFEPIMDKSTYYQIDTEGMIKGAIEGAFNEAVREMANTKGYRDPAPRVSF